MMLREELESLREAREAFDEVRDRTSDVRLSVEAEQSYAIHVESRVSDGDFSAEEARQAREAVREVEAEHADVLEEVAEVVSRLDHARGVLRREVVSLVEQAVEPAMQASLRHAWGPKILQEWRRIEDLSARHAAELLGVTDMTVLRYESGQRRPTFDRLAQQAHRLHAGRAINEMRHFGLQFPGIDSDPTPEEVHEEVEQRIALLAQLAADLDIAQLDFLVRLASTPDAVSVLSKVGPDPLRAALSDVAAAEVAL